jgi:hypothetical protein
VTAGAAASNTRSWKVFAELINGSWRKGANIFIDTGRYLLEAKAELDRDVFDALVKQRLDFEASVGRRLMVIADTPLICAHAHKLPPCWTTIYELTKLEPEVLKAAFESGDIHPGMQRKDAVALRHKDEPGDEAKALAPTVQAESPSALDILEAAWEAAKDPDRQRLFEKHGRAEIIAAMPSALLDDLHDHFEQQYGRCDSKKARRGEIDKELRDCSALLEHPEQNRDAIRKKPARARKLNGAEGQARRSGTTKSNARLDHDAFKRGLGMAGQAGEKIPTLTLTPTADASGNIIHRLPRA